MAQERFLILGASSFYGAHFALQVKQRGDDVLIPRPSWRLGEPLDPLILEDADYIINFASQSLVAESWEAPEVWTHTNLTCTTNLISEASTFKDIKKFIHVSTPESYGHTDTWVDERHGNWKPSTPYAVSRAAADMMLMAYHRAYGFPAIITRTANIYGPGQGENRIIPLAFKTLCEGKPLALHGGGSTVRSFIHVRDACAATYLLAKEGAAGETYHISTQRKTRIADLMEMIRCRVGADQHLIGTQPDRLGKDQAYLLASNKLREMGWQDHISLEEGLDECAKK